MYVFKYQVFLGSFHELNILDCWNFIFSQVWSIWIAYAFNGKFEFKYERRLQIVECVMRYFAWKHKNKFLFTIKWYDILNHVYQEHFKTTYILFNVCNQLNVEFTWISLEFFFTGISREINVELVSRESHVRHNGLCIN